MTTTTADNERLSPRAMAVSSDVILTSRHSSADLSASVQMSSKQHAVCNRVNGVTTDTDTRGTNAAASYGVDTVHSWATRHEQLSTWQSDVDIHSRSETVCLNTSPTHAPLSTGISVPDVREQIPIPPPRTRRKARVALAVTSADHQGLYIAQSQ